MRTRLANAAFAISIASTGFGCTTLDRYSTAANESYCGSITLSSAFRSGLSQRVQMRLQLDATQIDGESSPGTVWTYEAGDSKTAAQRFLDGASLRRIPKLENDALSEPDLGQGRDHTRLFAVAPADAVQDPLLVALSLRSDDGVEVRLLRPGVAVDAGSPTPAGRGAIFGLFILYKQVGTCGF